MKSARGNGSPGFKVRPITITREDNRQDYGEERLVCFGLLDDEVVVMVYTKRPRGTHVISLRKAEKHEARYYRQAAKENFGQGR